MTEKLENIVSARGYVKANITRISGYVRSKEFADASLSILQAKKERLLESFAKYERYNIRIL